MLFIYKPYVYDMYIHTYIHVFQLEIYVHICIYRTSLSTRRMAICTGGLVVCMTDDG